MGVLLALRRLGDPEVARFLDDPDPRLVLEAARAINDVPITAAHARAGRAPVSSNMPAAAVAAGPQRQLPAGRGRARRRAGRGRRAVGLAGAGAGMALELLASGPSRRAATRSWGSGGRFPPGPPSRPPTRSRPKLAALLASAPGRVRTAAVHAPRPCESRRPAHRSRPWPPTASRLIGPEPRRSRPSIELDDPAPGRRRPARR